MPKQKFYVVWVGRTTGIFDNWDECRRSVEGYPDPKYKSFDNYNNAVIVLPVVNVFFSGVLAFK